MKTAYPLHPTGRPAFANFIFNGSMVILMSRDIRIKNQKEDKNKGYHISANVLESTPNLLGFLAKGPVPIPRQVLEALSSALLSMTSFHPMTSGHISIRSQVLG